MSQKHKLTNTVKAEIRIAIEDLPVMYMKGIYKKVQVSGRRLIREGIKELKGDPVDIDGKYIRNELVRINHYERAQKEYREGGATALIAYIIKVKTSARNEEKNSVPNN